MKPVHSVLMIIRQSLCQLTFRCSDPGQVAYTSVSVTKQYNLVLWCRPDGDYALQLGNESRLIQLV